MNCIQYTAESFSSKDEVKKQLWPRACSGKTPVYFISSPNLDTLVHILDTGHAIQRGGTHTSFVWLDYDNVDGELVSIDQVRESLRGYQNISVVQSSSGSPYKYHIIQELPYEFPMESIGNECQRLKRLVQSQLPQLRTFDGRCDLPDQALFGAPTTHKGRTIFPGSIRIHRIAKKTENPMDLQCPDDTALYIPLNSAALAKMRGVTTLDENGYRFDVLVPSMVPKFKKIPEGSRYNWCQNLMMRLMLRCFHLTENCNYPVKKSDYTRTLTYLIFNNVVNPDSFFRDDGKCIIGMADRLWDRLESRSFENKVFNLAGYFSKQETPKKRYTSQDHIYEVTLSLLSEWKMNGYMSISGDTIYLPHRRYLEDIAKVYNTTYTSIAKAAKVLGYTLQWKEIPIDTFLVHPEGFLIAQRGKVTDTLRKWLKRHSMPYKTLSKEKFLQACKQYPTYKQLSRTSNSRSIPTDTPKDTPRNASKIARKKQDIFDSSYYPPPSLVIGSHKNVSFLHKSDEIDEKTANFDTRVYRKKCKVRTTEKQGKGAKSGNRHSAVKTVKKGGTREKDSRKRIRLAGHSGDCRRSEGVTNG